jgi:hypothetical protein
MLTKAPNTLKMQFTGRLRSNEKELIWIEGTTRRFKDGYNWFGRHPEKVLAFLDKYTR